MRKIYLALVMAFMFVVMSLPVMAAAPYVTYDYNGVVLQSFNDMITDEYKYAFLYKTDGNYKLILSTSEIVANEDSYGFEPKEDGYYKTYSYVNGIWSGGDRFTAVKGQAYINVSREVWKTSNYPIWVSQDLKNKDGSLYLKGDVNFREAPLAEKILIQAGEHLEKETAPELVGTMKILLVCGVGLMALLISLPLFGKVFNRYLH